MRYPRGGEGIFREDTFDKAAVEIRPGSDLTICTYGAMVSVALQAAELLAAQGISAAVFKVNRLTEADAQLLSCVHGGRLLVLEDCVEEGCLGQHIAALLQQNGQNIRLKLCNLGSSFVTHGKVEQLYNMLGIDAAGVAESAKELCHG